ncbi:YciI family protein [Flagellatimonas centrodinii]|uniref:YciI family protein n=1 Tax=Flagellatimonas centrodinii TaxID=2806210 RepID=UPI001FEF6539|nr:YciI family protein [Flagellatimonas centrodinii]ULQ45914.1 YciI family protein [Flagellatimonas centrodinii]
MQYLILATDRPGTAAIRRATRPAHLEYLAALQAEGRLLLAGPRLLNDVPDPAGGVIGSVIVGEFASLAEARDWADRDPYAQAGLFEQVRIEPMLKVLPA